jgi:hypothetical protein
MQAASSDRVPLITEFIFVVYQHTIYAHIFSIYSPSEQF